MLTVYRASISTCIGLPDHARRPLDDLRDDVVSEASEKVKIEPAMSLGIASCNRTWRNPSVCSPLKQVWKSRISFISCIRALI